jgi:hypothetical protein
MGWNGRSRETREWREVCNYCEHCRDLDGTNDGEVLANVHCVALLGIEGLNDAYECVQ